MLENENVTGNLWTRLTALEPAVIRGALVSVFAVLALLGIEWATEDSAVTIATGLVSLLPLLAGIIIRPAVTPNVKAAATQENGDGGYEAGEAAPYPEGTPVDIVLEESPRANEYREDNGL
jgi:uncharacterized membrane protein